VVNGELHKPAQPGEGRGQILMNKQSKETGSDKWLPVSFLAFLDLNGWISA
jgi:hypothetical protein